ncbi:MAG TPA: carbon-nitrogen hydrolase family protein [Bryobacteraceae bacterium]|nr:carbon-nitrogen hydrolase family protein [Bryobacteraceae bacterium]
MKLNRRSFVSSSAAALAGAQAASAQPPVSSVPELRVAACQILTFPDTRQSAEKICSWIEKAASDKIDIVTFPEAAVCGYASDPEYWKAANPRDFEAAEATIVASARELNIAVVLGSAHWEDGKVYNSVLAIDKDGRVKGRYSKTFLAESWPTPGRNLPVWTLAGVKSCFIICHDIRYPELVRLPAVAGAQICHYSSNESGLVEEHKLSAYRAMPISRATENSIYLVMANAPADPANMRAQEQSHGNSKIIHPNGTVLVEAGYFKETLVAATIDIKAADRSMARRAAREDGMIGRWLREGCKLVEGDGS